MNDRIPMMSDRELLRLAAIACGELSTEWVNNEAYFDGVLCRWNPLDDDGDALRLAVALRLSIDHNHSADQQRWVAADRQGCEGCYSPVSCIEDEFDESQRDTATRRAIVRAAAEIGRGMS